MEGFIGQRLTEGRQDSEARQCDTEQGGQKGVNEM